LHLSEEWYRIYGFDPEEGLSAWEKRLQRTNPEDRAKWQAAVDRAIREKSDYEVEVRIVLPDGTVKYIHAVGHPVLNAAGDVVQFVGNSTDVTERKRADEERERLLASERASFAEAVAAQQRFRDLVNSVEGIVWEADVPSFQFCSSAKQAERVSATRWNAGCPNRHSGRTTCIPMTEIGLCSSAKVQQPRNATTNLNTA